MKSSENIDMKKLTRLLFLSYFCIFTFFSSIHSAFATDSLAFKSAVTQTYLKTVKLQRTDLALSLPVILLGSSDQLILSWDDLRPGSTANYYYTFKHCNKDWQQSGLSFFDFLDGFEKNTVDEYAFSFATYQPYTHYSIQFPNDYVSFKVSGNYVIEVWEEDNDTLPVITQQFYVWEDLATVSGQVLRPNLVAYRTEHQEINFTVDIKNLNTTNPYDEVRVVLKQNNRNDNSWIDLKPRFINNNILTFDDDNTVFYAGKEYRRFDTRTLRFQTDRIIKIEKGYKRYDVYVNTDESRSFKQYFYEKDMNGNYVILADLTNNPDLEADYAYIHFTLQYPYFLTNGDFYVVGDFNQYAISAENKMVYDFDKQTYNSTLYLKQGYYNYMYVFVDKNKPLLDMSYAEGNYFETENDYPVFVYEHSYDRDYDRLVGYKLLNSIKR